MNWWTDLGKIVETALFKDYRVKQAFNNKIFQGELAEQKTPAAPIFCYIISPASENLGYFTGILKCQFALSIGSSKETLFATYKTIKTLLEHQRFTTTEVALVIGRLLSGPERLYDLDMKCDYLVASWEIKGIELK